MRADVRQWVDLAEADYGCASREAALPPGPNITVVCFHAQQCVEKYLKAALACRNIQFTRTHDLTGLSDLLRPVEPAWTGSQHDLDIVQPGAVLIRYAMMPVTPQDAFDALAACERLRAILVTIVF